VNAPSDQQLARLYALAIDVRAAQPWNIFQEDQLFAIGGRHGSDDIDSAMGAAGEHLAIEAVHQ